MTTAPSDAPAIRRVVIAGGGTAGWIAAAALVRHLGPLLDITLVESDEIGTVGVGEATIPTARSFHQLLGIDERAFVSAAKASFKLGIAFENWGRIGDRYIHSFGQIGPATWMGDFQHYWLEARAQGLAGPLARYSLETQAAEAGRFAIADTPALSYAYHLDAGLYARFLRTLAEGAGVTRIEGRIASVEQNAGTGMVEALALADGRRVEGDLFIDCSGFRGLLIEQTLRAGYEDWGHWLVTDSAIAVQTRSMEPARPYTRAIAHGEGWQWRIPLQHRTGNGIVYSSAFLDDDAARERLLGSVEGETLTEPRLIRYRTGRRRVAWDRNVVALGLSAGFVEPLESTSIHLIMIGVTRLIQTFPFAGFDPALVARYNEESRREMEGVRDFVLLHYRATERDDTPFWERCRTMAIPDTLAQRIALFAGNAQAYQGGEELFRADSWVQVLLGQRVEPAAWHRLARMMPRDRLQKALTDLGGTVAAGLSKLPSHQDFLERYAR